MSVSVRARCGAWMRSAWRDWMTRVFVATLACWVLCGVAVFRFGASLGLLFVPILVGWLVLYVAGPDIDRWLTQRGFQK